LTKQISTESLLEKKTAEVMKLVGTTEGAKRFPEEEYMKCSADGYLEI
jgi:hypothetical protein